MRFLNVIPYWGVEYGGPFVNISNISVNLVLNGHESTIITTSKTPEQFGSTYPLRIGNQEIKLPIYVCKSFENTFCFSSEFVKKLSELARKNDCIFIHGFWRFPTTFASSFCRNHRIPYCIFTHAMFTPWSLSQNKLMKRIYLRLFEKENLNNANYIFAYNDNELIELQRRKIDTKVCHFTNALNKDEILESYKIRQESKKSALSNVFNILYLSRIHPKKGLLLLIDAIRELIQTRTDIRLVVAGPSENIHYLKKIKDFIKKNRLGDYIFFKGIVTGEDKRRTFSEADIFVLPSLDEASFPLAVLEAMSFGLPVVVTAGCKMPGIDNKMGYVKEYNPSAIASAILKLIENRELAEAMGTTGFEYVLNNFTWDKKIVELIQIIENNL